ncbi:uncharacterized protein [Diabrotica undecimpunctata]|uniref:uncharacterized protein n=1 Tax=Diabrotica undecimpunctata TaxID=50387 RepID=UPI003B63A354
MRKKQVEVLAFIGVTKKAVPPRNVSSRQENYVERWPMSRLPTRDLESERQILYLDETWFDTHDVPKYDWVDSSGRCTTKVSSNKEKGITIIDAGTKNGFIPNALALSFINIKDSRVDYHNDTTSELFENWCSTKLLPSIPPNSVIVMDNASYHSRRLIKFHVLMTQNVESRNICRKIIYYEDNYSKQQLLETLKSLSIRKQYYCDSLAKEMGNTVLRLPPYYCLFNPIEHIWHERKASVRRNNVSLILTSSVGRLIELEMEKITNDCWKTTDRLLKETIIIDLHNGSDSETDLTM